MQSEGIVLCVIYCLATFLWTWTILGNTPKESELLSEAKQVIKECEATIPRNQVCQLKAIVKGE